MFTEEGENMDTPKRKSAINERMEALVNAPLAVEDALVGLFDHSDHTLQRRVVETYVRRLYQVLFFNVLKVITGPLMNFSDKCLICMTSPSS